MRIFLVKLAGVWESDQEKKKLKMTRRDYLLQECGVFVPVKDDTYFDSYGDDELVVTGEQMCSMMVNKIDFTLKHEAVVPTELNLTEALEKAIEKINKLALPSAGELPSYNQKCDVHMPGNLLMTFNRTMLLEDSCTDALQEKLDNGWRVIAACPQPDQRRPDYILGRFEPEDELSGRGAKRRHD